MQWIKRTRGEKKNLEVGEEQELETEREVEGESRTQSRAF